jgi:hypothetical protein
LKARRRVNASRAELRKPRAKSKPVCPAQQVQAAARQGSLLQEQAAFVGQSGLNASLLQRAGQTMVGESGFSQKAYVIEGRGNKWRRGRNRGKHEFVQSVLLDHFNGMPPEDVTGHKKWLVEEINLQLGERQDYQAKFPGAKVNNMTIARALDGLRKRDR